MLDLYSCETSVELRATDDRISEDCFFKNENAPLKVSDNMMNTDTSMTATTPLALRTEMFHSTEKLDNDNGTSCRTVF